MAARSAVAKLIVMVRTAVFMIALRSGIPIYPGGPLVAKWEKPDFPFQQSALLPRWFLHSAQKRRWGGLRAGAVALTVAATVLCFCNLRARSPSELRPPVTMTQTVTDNYHGVEGVDDYRCLEDQQSPATRAWIDAENKYT
jgi:hypothetical protein